MLLAPASPDPYIKISYIVLVGYVAFAFFAAALLSFSPQRWTVPAPAVHAVDLSVAAAVTLFSGDTNNPFWVLFLFTLLAAAYRWGFAETVATAFAAVLLLSVEAVVAGLALHTGGPFFQGQFETSRLIMRSAYLLTAGVLTGYLADNEKQFRVEITAIAEIMSRADVRAGLRQTMAGGFRCAPEAFRSQAGVARRARDRHRSAVHVGGRAIRRGIGSRGPLDAARIGQPANLHVRSGGLRMARGPAAPRWRDV